jgi:hypothetical protein
MALVLLSLPSQALASHIQHERSQPFKGQQKDCFL